MNTGQIILLLAFAFSCALPAFVFAARQKGWPRGEIFEEGKIPTFVAIGCLAVLGGKLLAAIVSGQIGLFWLLWGVVAYFVGGPLLLAALGRWSGMISLIMAPVLSVTGIFLKL
ncbi:MAG: hypothetical protein KF751_09520 [Nitrospira sp.]|nr:hypothetical protein [Nitrospira sp.]